MKIQMGSKLKDLRQEKGLKQIEVLDKIFIEQGTLSMFENNKALPSLETLIRFAELYDVTTDYLLGLEDDFGNKTNETSEAYKAATPLTIDEREMLALWRELPQDKKNNFINLLKK